MRNEMTLLSHLAWKQTSQSFWFQSGSTVFDPLPERSRSIERAIEAASAKSTTRCASRGFIEAHQEEYAVNTMCRVLDVSISGYYAWKKRPPCARQREDGELTQRLVQAFHRHHGVYGSPRLVA